MRLKNHVSMPRLLSLVANRYVFFLLFLLGYTSVMEELGGLPSVWGAWRLEIPLLAYLYYYFNRILRPSRLQALLAAAPIMLFYLATDVYFLLLGRLPHITEVSELPEMFRILHPSMIALAVTVVGLPLLAFIINLNLRKPHAILIGALPLAALILSAERWPDAFMTAFNKTQKEVVFYSDAHSTRNNGRLGMMLYNEARRKSYLEKIANYRDNPSYRQDFEKAVDVLKDENAKRNVHLLVLESFIDPTLLKGAHFSRPPADISFTKLFGNKGGFSVSPVFGGGTAQAEFEVLCGVPALRELSGVEFDVFTGAKTYCLPNLLTQAGYETDATNSFVPDYYNSTKAYAGLGFSHTYYPQEYAKGLTSYFSNGDTTDEMYIFDGTLLSQNLDFISRKIKEHPEQPIFNYIIGIYGHTPHDINTEKRPEVIGVTGKVKDEQLDRAVNQYYYRTQAIAAFVNGLLKVDPHSLIILVSDHLPPLTYGPNTYNDLDYLNDQQDSIHMNRVYFIENGRAVRYSTIHHFDIPRIVLNYVSRGEYCQEHACGFKSGQDADLDRAALRDEYLTIMAQAMGYDEAPPAPGAPAENQAPAAMPPPAVTTTPQAAGA